MSASSVRKLQPELLHKEPTCTLKVLFVAVFRTSPSNLRHILVFQQGIRYFRIPEILFDNLKKKKEKKEKNR